MVKVDGGAVSRGARVSGPSLWPMSLARVSGPYEAQKCLCLYGECTWMDIHLARMDSQNTNFFSPKLHYGNRSFIVEKIPEKSLYVSITLQCSPLSFTTLLHPKLNRLLDTNDPSSGLKSLMLYDGSITELMLDCMDMILQLS